MKFPPRVIAYGIIVGLALCLTVKLLATENPANHPTGAPPKTKSTSRMNQEITSLLKSYEKALNISDTEAALRLYGSDPIFMAQNAPAFIGREAVRASYRHIFETIKLNVVFTVQEIVEMGGNLAYGRTTSAGQQEILASRKVSKEANNELFIFRKEQGKWKIHRYLFATSNPPTAD